MYCCEFERYKFVLAATFAVENATDSEKSMEEANELPPEVRSTLHNGEGLAAASRSLANVFHNVEIPMKLQRMSLSLLLTFTLENTDLKNNI